MDFSSEDHLKLRSQSHPPRSHYQGLASTSCRRNLENRIWGRAWAAGSKQRVMRNKRQATRREVPRQRKSKGDKLGRHQARFARALAQQHSRFKKTSAVLQTAKNAVLTARSRAKTERVENLRKSACRRTTSSAGAAGGKSFKSRFFFAGTATGKVEPRNGCARSDFRSSPAMSSGWKQKSMAESRKNSRHPETTTRPRKTRRAPGRNRARGHPLQRRTQDHRATSPAAGPRRARGSTADARPQPQKRANLARGKFCDFSPDLGFEWQGRFSSPREARRAANETPGRAHTLSTSS